MCEGEETVVKMSNWTLSGGDSHYQAVVGTKEQDVPTIHRGGEESKRSKFLVSQNSKAEIGLETGYFIGVGFYPTRALDKSPFSTQC